MEHPTFTHNFLDFFPTTRVETFMSTSRTPLRNFRAFGKAFKYSFSAANFLSSFSTRAREVGCLRLASIRTIAWLVRPSGAGERGVARARSYMYHGAVVAGGGEARLAVVGFVGPVACSRGCGGPSPPLAERKNELPQVEREGGGTDRETEKETEGGREERQREAKRVPVVSATTRTATSTFRGMKDRRPHSPSTPIGEQKEKRRD